MNTTNKEPYHGMRKSLWLLLLIFLFTPLSASADIEVRFLDVGDADAALIQCDGHAMLIDGGNKDDSSMMYAVLKQANITHLDIIVASHVHEDHIGGIPGALNFATADLILCPTKFSTEIAFADFEKYANEKGTGITIPNVGDTYSLGDAKISILGVNSTVGINNSSIILKITYGKTSFLFTGDAEADAEWAVLSSEVDLSANVLKVGHHGSATSTTYTFLKEVNPSFAVISVGTESKHEMPSSIILDRLQNYDAIVYRTDKHGNITFTSDGNKISATVETSRFLIDNGSSEVEEGVTYIVNTNTGKFHEPDCRHAKSIKDKNRAEHTGTRDQLIEYGYIPCKVCDP